jgi:O-antigen/teichoic acid export membrane protein
VIEPVIRSSGGSADDDRRTAGAAGRIGRGLAANAAGNAITALIQIVSVPVLLASWGVATYGEWLIVSAVPTYLALSDLGFATAAGNSMTMLAAHGRRSEAITLGRQVWSFTTLTSGLVILGAIGVGFALAGFFGSESAMSAAEVRAVLVALFLQVAVSIQYAMRDAWYRAGGRYPLGVAFRQLGRLTEFGAMMAVVLLGGRPGDAAVAFLLTSALGLGLSSFVLLRAVPWSSLRPEWPDIQNMRLMLRPGLAFMTFPLGTAISIQGFVILIGATMGSAALVVWSTTRTFTRMALQMMMSINLSVWPELSRSVGSGNHEQSRTILRSAVQLSLVSSLTLLVLLSLVGPTFIYWWTSGVVASPAGLLDALLIVMVANSVWFTIAIALVATNRHSRMAVVNLAGTTLALILAIPLTQALGLPGAALALLVIDAGMAAYVIPASLAVVDDSAAPFLRSLLDIRGAIRGIMRRLRHR